MLSTSMLFCALALGGAPATVDSVCQQAAPAQPNGKFVRSANQKQAVVLIHGYYVHFTDKNVAKPGLRAWQQSTSPLVQELGKNADVFVFAYGQNASIDTIVKESKLAANIAELKKLGYSEIVFVGHSAGGLIARHFVEDNPNAGVTKVVQVCAPNAGSPLAGLIAPKTQKPFMECLTADARKKCLEMRGEKKIPNNVQFVCVLSCLEKDKTTDGVVPCASQWSADLQKQGIPVLHVVGTHRGVVHDAAIAPTIANLVRERHERWPENRVEEAKKKLFGE